LRSEYIQAKLKIESDDKGTLIILEVPYETSQMSPPPPGRS
jgi:hypothetical protein